MHLRPVYDVISYDVHRDAFRGERRGQSESVLGINTAREKRNLDAGDTSLGTPPVGGPVAVGF